jgi:hypothetical protein
MDSIYTDFSKAFEKVRNEDLGKWWTENSTLI